MNWALSAPPSHKVGCVQKHIHHGHGICEIYVRQALMHRFHREMAHVSVAPTPATIPSLCKPASMVSWGVLYDQSLYRGREDSGLSFVQMVPHQRWAPLESGHLQHDSSFLGHPWRTMVKWNPPREQNFQAMDLIVHFALKEKWPDTWLYTDSWDVANDLAGLSRTWKGYDWKIGDKEVSGRDMDRYVLEGWKMWRYL